MELMHRVCFELDFTIRSGLWELWKPNAMLPLDASPARHQKPKRLKEGDGSTGVTDSIRRKRRLAQGTKMATNGHAVKVRISDVSDISDLQIYHVHC